MITEEMFVKFMMAYLEQIYKEDPKRQIIFFQFYDGEPERVLSNGGSDICALAGIEFATLCQSNNISKEESLDYLSKAYDFAVNADVTAEDRSDILDEIREPEFEA